MRTGLFAMQLLNSTQLGGICSLNRDREFYQLIEW